MYKKQNIGKQVVCAYCNKEFIISDEICGQIKGNDGVRFACSTKCFVNYVQNKEKNKDG